MADPTPVGKSLMWHPQFNVPDMLPAAINHVVNFQDMFVEDEAGTLQPHWGLDMLGGNWPVEVVDLAPGISLGDL